MSAYAYWCNAVVRDKQVLEMLVAAIATPRDAVRAWDVTTKVYPAGTTFTPQAHPLPPLASAEPVGRLVKVPMTQRGYELCAEFLGSGPWPLLNARGMTDGQIGYAKSKVVGETGDRSTYESHTSQFLADNGYVTP